VLKVAFLCEHPQNIVQVYGAGRRERLATLCDLHPAVLTQASLASAAARRQIEAVFSTWGMPALQAGDLDGMPKLRAVFYAAGSVHSFARPFLERQIDVISAWSANARPVAEFTLAQILLANKGYFTNFRQASDPQLRRSGSCFTGPGNFGATVALLGAGQIGRQLIELLRPFELHVVVFDPFLNEADAQALGVEKVTLEDAFARGQVVSNHLANNAATRGLIGGMLLANMQPHAVFINTGRGASVVESELIQTLRDRPDLTALLDVTDPEPPVADSPLYQMPNVLLSSHIAGSLGQEVVRMADYMIDEFGRWQAGQPLRYGVSLAMLERMA
jgi:phosphoglycerate dehydrogenase-like enzyme